MEAAMLPTGSGHVMTSTVITANEKQHKVGHKPVALSVPAACDTEKLPMSGSNSIVTRL